jgi:hypothetical protein
MTFWLWLYVTTVGAALGRMLCLEYRRMRCSDSLGPASRSGERVYEAFSAWSREIAETIPERVQPIILEAPELPAEWPGLVNEPAAAQVAPPPEPLIEPAPVQKSQPEQFEMNPEPPPYDYYEILQISRSADVDTIHRVYRMMAARFHPDNAATGDVEKFLKLRDACHVLSDPNRRAEYDRQLACHVGGPLPVFGQKGFVDGLSGEINRRLGVLSLLYNRRRMNEESPGISMLDLERLMAFPREYLQFTLWYLKGKGLVTVGGNSDYDITAPGVDYLEEHSAKNKLIRDLLTGGSEDPGRRIAPKSRNPRRARRRHHRAAA